MPKLNAADAHALCKGTDERTRRDVPLFDEHFAEHPAARPLLSERAVKLLLRNRTFGEQRLSDPNSLVTLAHKKLRIAELTSS